jgi:hypothetical protein
MTAFSMDSVDHRGCGLWLGASSPGENSSSPAHFLSRTSVTSAAAQDLLTHLDRMLEDARRLGIQLPPAFLFQDGQVIYAGQRPVEVRLRGWSSWGGSGPRGTPGVPWRVGGPCLVRTERDRLHLLPQARGLHHRSLRVEVRERGLFLLGVWALPVTPRPAQLSLGFDPIPPGFGHAEVLLEAHRVACDEPPCAVHLDTVPPSMSWCQNTG